MVLPRELFLHEDDAKENVLPDQQLGAFEAEVACVTRMGGDIVKVWSDYAAWAETNDPAQRRDILQRAVTALSLEEKRYASDVRYFILLIRHLDYFEDSSKEYTSIAQRGVCIEHALLYEVWATSLERNPPTASAVERQRRFAEAEAVYQLGIERGAKPLERLQASHRKFLGNMEMRKNRDRKREEKACRAVSREASAKAKAASTVEGASPKSRATIVEGYDATHAAKLVVREPFGVWQPLEEAISSVTICKPLAPAFPTVTSTVERTIAGVARATDDHGGRRQTMTFGPAHPELEHDPIKAKRMRIDVVEQEEEEKEEKEEEVEEEEEEEEGERKERKEDMSVEERRAGGHSRRDRFADQIAQQAAAVEPSEFLTNYCSEFFKKKQASDALPRRNDGAPSSDMGRAGCSSVDGTQRQNAIENRMQRRSDAAATQQRPQPRSGAMFAQELTAGSDVTQTVEMTQTGTLTRSGIDAIFNRLNGRLRTSSSNSLRTSVADSIFDDPTCTMEQAGLELLSLTNGNLGHRRRSSSTGSRVVQKAKQSEQSKCAPTSCFQTSDWTPAHEKVVQQAAPIFTCAALPTAAAPAVPAINSSSFAVFCEFD